MIRIPKISLKTEPIKRSYPPKWFVNRPSAEETFGSLRPRESTCGLTRSFWVSASHRNAQTRGIFTPFLWVSVFFPAFLLDLLIYNSSPSQTFQILRRPCGIDSPGRQIRASVPRSRLTATSSNQSTKNDFQWNIQNQRAAAGSAGSFRSSIQETSLLRSAGRNLDWLSVLRCPLVRNLV